MKTMFTTIIFSLLISIPAAAQNNTTNTNTNTKTGTLPTNTAKLGQFMDKIGACIEKEDELQSATNRKSVKKIKKELRECRFEFEDQMAEYADDPDYAELGPDGAMELIGTLQFICSTLNVSFKLREKHKLTNIFTKDAKKIVCNEGLDSVMIEYQNRFCKNTPKPGSCATVDKISKNMKNRG